MKKLYQKKFKSVWMSNALIRWLSEHSKTCFQIESNFNALVNKILIDYAKANGFDENKEDKSK